MKPLIHLDYPYDFEALNSIARILKPSADFLHPVYAPNAKMLRIKLEFFEEVISDFNLIHAEPRIIWLEPNTELPEHIDETTKCSLNFIASPDPAPITIEGTEYFYRQCLLDTTKLHSVKNNNTERVLFKISIRDRSFEEMSKIIPNYYRG